MILVPDYSQPTGFQSQFSSGDFSALSPLPDSKVKMNVQVDEDVSVKVDLDHDGESLFSCPNDGCIKTYIRHSALENHLFYGKCELRPVKETHMDQAKALYYEKLQSDASAPPPSLEGMPLPRFTTTEALPEGWALRSSKKSTRFSETQKNYLKELASFRLLWKLALNLIQPRLPEICDTPEMQREKNFSALKNS